MYSVVLVDDEQMIRESIIELVDWNKAGFEMIGQASNGDEALEFIEKNTPDILITDIKMPIMDGIQLAKEVREKHPSVKIIFLSGYDEFEYAISGIKLNIIEYLLKPISRVELEETLKKVKKNLDKEQREARDLKLAEANYQKDIDVVRMSYLLSLIMENYESTSMAETNHLLQLYQLNLSGSWKVLINVNIDRSSIIEDESAINQFELMKYSLSNVVRKIMNKYVNGEVFAFTSNVVIILADTKENIELYRDIIVKEIEESVKKLLSFDVFIGVSEEYQNLNQTNYAFQSSLSALNYSMHLRKNKSIYISDMEKRSEMHFYFDDKKESKLISALKMGTKQEVDAHINAILDVWMSENEGVFRGLILELYVSLLKAYRQTVEEYDESIIQHIHITSELYSYENREESKRRVKLFAFEMMNQIDNQRKKKQDSIAEKSLQYLKEHYTDPSISLKTVSKMVHLSPSYFSTLFKKEIGESFTDALTRIRMEHAKEQLLMTDNKILGVAMQTGFTDQHYFSYSFKKYYGISPNMMRKEFQKEKIKRE
ncbi:MAG TPA: response regulator [Candidatus Jeotgalibaca pullicola]|nr:response regulator [Candidatus Jeotgalibaca pullicola]